MRDAWGWTEDDHICNVLPLHHIHGIMNVLNTSLYSGAQCTLIPKYDSRKVWDILLDETNGNNITTFMAVPAIYKKMINQYENDNMITRAEEIKKEMKKLRLMVSGSAALPVDSMLRWKEITGHTLLERFGMTEIGMAISNPYFDVEQRIPGHVGHPFPGVKARLLDLDSNELHEDFDKEGELLIRSNCMFSRYHNNEEITKNSFFTDGSGNEWFKTGDVALKSSEHDGAFRILGRLSQDIIKKQGFKISALELESSLSLHKSVNECAVIGVPNEEYGEEIVAFIALNPGLS